MQKKEKITQSIEIPSGIQASVEGQFLTLKGPKGEHKKKIYHKKIDITIDGNKLTFSLDRITQREQKMLGTFKAHIKNMIKGVTEMHIYTLKICSGHFPMTVAVNKGQLVVKNLLGEKIPRVLDIIEGATVKVEGEIITVESVDKEKAGQCAASIEKLTRRTGYDLRIFQDGIWLTSKDGHEVK